MSVGILVGLMMVLGSGALASTMSTGPFEGTIADGETHQHHYQNAEPGSSCPDVMAQYVVTLRYAPEDDSLALAAGGQSATGSDGYAQVTFWDNYCTSFTITVHGVSVKDLADYTVTVDRQSGGWATY